MPKTFYCNSGEKFFSKKKWVKHKKEHRIQAHRESFNKHKAMFGLRLPSTSNLPTIDMDQTSNDPNYDTEIDVDDVMVDIYCLKNDISIWESSSPIIKIINEYTVQTNHVYKSIKLT
jgi:hypothetical protein